MQCLKSRPGGNSRLHVVIETKFFSTLPRVHVADGSPCTEFPDIYPMSFSEMIALCSSRLGGSKLMVVELLRLRVYTIHQLYVVI